MVRDLTTFVMVDPAKLGGLSNVNFLAFAKVFTLQSWIAFFSLSILCAVGYMSLLFFVAWYTERSAGRGRNFVNN